MNSLKDSLDLNGLKTELVRRLGSAGFEAVEEYTDTDSRKIRGDIAVWSVDEIQLTAAGMRIDTAMVSARAEISVKVRLMGEVGTFEDHIEFDDKCFDACAEIACMWQFGAYSVKLGRTGSDMQQKRLVREMDIRFRVSMSETRSVQS